MDYYFVEFFLAATILVNQYNMLYITSDFPPVSIATKDIFFPLKLYTLSFYLDI
jgi:hypothetical protein